jgi:hypothetical protein
MTFQPTIEEMDKKMYEAFDRYSKGDLSAAYIELDASLIADYLSNQGNVIAKNVRTTMISQEERQRLADISSERMQLEATIQTFQNKLDMYSKNDYEIDVRRYGTEKANQTRREYTAQLETAISNAEKNRKNFESETNRIKLGVPGRIADYENAKVETPLRERNSVVEINRVVADIQAVYPEPTPQSNKMLQQVRNVHENYLMDVSYSSIISGLFTDLNQSAIPNAERDLELKKRKVDIQNYYTLNYQQQVWILKVVIVFTLFALVGGLGLHYQLISSGLFSVYLGIVLGVGFIVLFYYLWDFYLRDSTNFDEYNFLTYLSPQKAANPDLNSDGSDPSLDLKNKDNIIYC